MEAHKVLIIDDQEPEFYRNFLRDNWCRVDKSILERWGLYNKYSWLKDTILDNGIAKTTEDPDIILLDLDLTQQNTPNTGLELLRDLLKDKPDIPVLVVSKYYYHGNVNCRNLVLQMGGIDLVFKDDLITNSGFDRLDTICKIIIQQAKKQSLLERERNPLVLQLNQKENTEGDIIRFVDSLSSLAELEGHAHNYQKILKKDAVSFISSLIEDPSVCPNYYFYGKKPTIEDASLYSLLNNDNPFLLKQIIDKLREFFYKREFKPSQIEQDLFVNPAIIDLNDDFRDAKRIQHAVTTKDEEELKQLAREAKVGLDETASKNIPRVLFFYANKAYYLELERQLSFLRGRVQLTMIAYEYLDDDAQWELALHYSLTASLVVVIICTNMLSDKGRVRSMFEILCKDSTGRTYMMCADDYPYDMEELLDGSFIPRLGEDDFNWTKMAKAIGERFRKQ